MIAINMTNKTGKVFITGAGPGDPGLITEKAKRALEKCDAVIYDHLVSLELIVPLPKKVERIYAGKSANRHTMKQEEINELLVKLAKEGKTVVRLKGGDPYIFGRGGEEALHLRENGVPFEIIPGITAGVAAPAYAGIPVTHRGKAVFAVFITAHEAAKKEGSEIPWRLLAGSNKGTIVGYMGVKTLPDTIARLLQEGMPQDTPAAVIEKGTTGKQVTVTGALENIAGKVQDAGIKPPAIFVIGETAALRHSIGERENQPLKGKTIMITRPGDQSQEIYREVRRTREGKPVIASMGSLAASGGYYIACPAYPIVANEGTLTGSIGVIMDFMNVEEMFDRIGLQFDVITSGRYKDIGSPTRPMEEDERVLLQELIDDVHDQFVEAIVESRADLDEETVRGFADGRIFSGRQALEHGLVDELGNFRDAVDLAAREAGIDGEPNLVYPRRRRPGAMEWFFESLFEAAFDAAATRRGQVGIRYQ